MNINIRFSYLLIGSFFLLSIFSGIYCLEFISFGLNIYYLIFLFNHFKTGQGEVSKSNLLFIKIPKMPIYLATATWLMIFISSKLDILLETKISKISIAMGVIVGVVSMLKQKQYARIG